MSDITVLLLLIIFLLMIVALMIVSFIVDLREFRNSQSVLQPRGIPQDIYHDKKEQAQE
jgi:uncharacterized SAM-binding protein YcdF (DUF218 family)